MRAVLFLAVLLATPSVAYAHSGAVFRVAVNYIPMLLALVPIFWTPISKFFRRWRDLFRKEDK
ncbi:hypothetical protein MAMMFC1_02482 [Methylomusa anaerophila]|uniref:Uncharacterized protein n=1 Tax=Methylomusa anaerophila TaxID=1930071 RepID=A0A348AL49_9FIRM|nr:hypothetical protein MAMMFC1_02482 [Methylomusa anaerophila]